MNTDEIWTFATKHPIVTLILGVSALGWTGAICASMVYRCK